MTALLQATAPQPKEASQDMPPGCTSGRISEEEDEDEDDEDGDAPPFSALASSLLTRRLATMTTRALRAGANCGSFTCPSVAAPLLLPRLLGVFPMVSAERGVWPAAAAAAVRWLSLFCGVSKHPPPPPPPLAPPPAAVDRVWLR